LSKIREGAFVTKKQQAGDKWGHVFVFSIRDMDWLMTWITRNIYIVIDMCMYVPTCICYMFLHVYVTYTNRNIYMDWLMTWITRNVYIVIYMCNKYMSNIYM
jgi:hypothetical protein